MVSHATARWTSAIVFLLTMPFLGCRQPPPFDPVADIQAQGKLIVLTRNAPTTYYRNREDEKAGFEYELAASYAEFLDVELELRLMDSTAAILTAIANNEGHFAAAGLTRTLNREQRFVFGPDYQEVRQQVVCGRGQPPPAEVEDLLDRRITIIGNSSYEEELVRLREFFPELGWTTVNDMETEQILERVWQGLEDCTVADSNIVAINRRYYPELKVGFSLTGEQPLAWVLAPKYAGLRPTMEAWLDQEEQAWRLDELLERYYGYVEIFDYVDIKRYLRRIRERLPLYEARFKEASLRYGIEWTLLAAQSYQESHWNPRARSPTGVRGMMMLTLRTSKQMGVTNRLDPDESILGGAKYLRRMMRRLPDSIQEPDRTWFALAAYNVGFGHLMDARKLAEEEGLDPNSWRDLQTVLPWLSKRQYYKRTRYGYARGREPVRYVQRIRDFKDILDRHVYDGLVALGD